MTLTWFADFAAYAQAVSAARKLAPRFEDYLIQLGTSLGWCCNCESIVPFQVDVGARLGPHPNLREGMRCQKCGLNNRSRLLLQAMLETEAAAPAPRVALFEALGPLHDAAKKRWPTLQASAYFGRGHASGTPMPFHGRTVTHQDATWLGYADGSLDLLAHNDVLEHVFDFRSALREAMRVLAPGGSLVFGVPFFYDLETTIVRGIENADGTVTDIETPEYHGDGLRRGGIYTYYHYGQDLLGHLRAAGFAVELGFAYDVFLGYVSNNFRYPGHGLMFPTVLRARKSG
jgi:SAM-dependent methyltransferase